MYKKQLAAGFLALMMLGLLSVSALANGGHGRSAYRARTVSCAVCTLEGGPLPVTALSSAWASNQVNKDILRELEV